ncbi:MAG: hypothetical protein JSS66_01335 [Armatimonadetes bacterium]|nr:hypothetical protein [Armatimonadota bacterium]
MDALNVQERGNAKPHQLRRDGLTPIGLVEKGKPTRKMQADTKSLRDAISHAQGIGIIEIQVEGESKRRTVFLKQVDRIPHTPQILNVTLNEISKNEVMTADVHVNAVGTPPEVAKGTGVLVAGHSTIKLKGKHSDLPGHLDVDVSHLEPGGSIHAGALQLPNGVELASSPDTTLFSVTHLRTAEPEAAPAASDEAPTGAESSAAPEEPQE